jgi:hypothetical protein
MKPRRKPLESFEFTETMNEVSGLGGAYERACQRIVTAGARWCAWHPEADLHFSEHPDARGFVESLSSDARMLRRVIDTTPFTTDDGRKVTLADEMTPAMYHTAIVHILYIATHGWNAYRDKMSAPFVIVEDNEDMPKHTEGPPP